MRLVFILGLTLALNAVSFTQTALPEGKGRDEVMAMCNSCHGLESVTKQRDGKKGWERMVNEMMGRGAVGTDQQVQLVIDYLAENFGKPVNVNKAISKQLQEAFGIPAKEGDAIFKYRQENGDFKTLDDLLNVPGISVEKIRPLSANIVFQ